MTEERKNLFNILVLSLSFMLVFTGFHTLSSVQALDWAKTEMGVGEGRARVHLAIVYVVFGVFSWISPSLVWLLGPRLDSLR